MGNEIEDIFLKICGRTGDGLNLVSSNHLRQRKAQFPRTHRPCQRNQHLATLIDVASISLRGVQGLPRVEVSEVML